MSLHEAPVWKVWPGFPDSGEMAALVRAHDWSATPLGPIEAWPQSLKTAVDLMLSSRQPVYVAWGPELTSLYNDGYIPIVGAKHPHGLGKPFDELWSEIRDEYRPLIEAVMAGEAQHFVDRPATLAGRDGVEVGYFTFSWTPLPIDTSGSLMKKLEPSVSEVDEPSTSGSGVVIAVQIWEENWTPHDRESSA